MATKVYFLNNTSSSLVTSDSDYQEICDMPLGFESTYLVMATFDFDREDVGTDEKRILLQVRLDLVAGLGTPLASDFQQVQLSGVVGQVGFDKFDRTPSSRHASLMVTATVPAEGGARPETGVPITLGEPETPAMPLWIPPPRAVLSARGFGLLGSRSGVAVSNIRIVAFPADEVVVKQL